MAPARPARRRRGAAGHVGRPRPRSADFARPRPSCGSDGARAAPGARQHAAVAPKTRSRIRARRPRSSPPRRAPGRRSGTSGPARARPGVRLGCAGVRRRPGPIAPARRRAARAQSEIADATAARIEQADQQRHQLRGTAGGGGAAAPAAAAAAAALGGRAAGPTSASRLALTLHPAGMIVLAPPVADRGELDLVERHRRHPPVDRGLDQFLLRAGDVGLGAHPLRGRRTAPTRPRSPLWPRRSSRR